MSAGAPRDQGDSDQRPGAPASSRRVAAEAERRAAENRDKGRVPAVDRLGKTAEIVQGRGALEHRADEGSGDERAGEALGVAHTPVSVLAALLLEEPPGDQPGAICAKIRKLGRPRGSSWNSGFRQPSSSPRDS